MTPCFGSSLAPSAFCFGRQDGERESSAPERDEQSYTASCALYTKSYSKCGFRIEWKTGSNVDSDLLGRRCQAQVLIPNRLDARCARRQLLSPCSSRRCLACLCLSRQSARRRHGPIFGPELRFSRIHLPRPRAVQRELQAGTSLTREGELPEAIPHLLAARAAGADPYATGVNLAICYIGTGRYKGGDLRARRTCAPPGSNSGC